MNSSRSISSVNKKVINKEEFVRANFNENISDDDFDYVQSRRQASEMRFRLPKL